MDCVPVTFCSGAEVTDEALQIRVRLRVMLIV